MSKDEAFALVRGSGNVVRDLGHADADREQLRALLAARIIGVLDDRGMTVRQAHEMTGLRRRIFRGYGRRSWDGLRLTG